MSHKLDDSTNWTTISRPSTISSRATNSTAQQTINHQLMSHKLDSSAEPSTIVHQIMSHQLDDSTNWTTISRPSTISS
jgi:hypothetical protein